MVSEKIVAAMLVLAVAVTAFNMQQLNSMGAATQSRTLASAETEESTDVIPKGTPEIYGQELQLSYDDVSLYDQYAADTTIKKLGLLDVGINLTEEQKQRYIDILYRNSDGMSCEYCCGTRAIIFENGEPACGCAHSYAMRGLAKYLITQHGDEYTDNEILEEVGKWKTLFFPDQITQKASVLREKGIATNYINLASNKYRGIEQGSEGGMVGGC